jgi:hypothetical protein
MQPYQDKALQYLESGLGYPIPSAEAFTKFPPLVGWTGKAGNIPSREQVVEWMGSHADSNILLRLAKNVIGIDVDDYDYKHGAATMFKAVKEHGSLGEPPYSSARGEGYSGIRYFQLAFNHDERRLKGDLGPDSHVEVIRYSHRYAVVPPSWHQGAEARYEWYPEIPHVQDLPILSTSWYGHLTQICKCFEKAREEQRLQLARYKRRPYNAQGEALAQMDLNHNMSLLERMPKGGRNNYLSRVAGRTFLFDCLHNNVLDSAEVYRKLLETGQEAGLQEPEIRATLLSAQAWAANMYEGDTV